MWSVPRDDRSAPIEFPIRADADHIRQLDVACNYRSAGVNDRRIDVLQAAKIRVQVFELQR
jgi:hypothetical protein